MMLPGRSSRRSSIKPHPHPALSRERIAELKAFQRTIGYRFRRIELLQEALTHTSYAGQHTQRPPDNERLEFLGDAVLDLIIGEYVFQQYPDRREGDLTKLRAQMVSKSALMAYAHALGIADLLLVHERRAGQMSKTSPSTNAGAVEALIGAMYLDGGLRAANRFLFRKLGGIFQEFESGAGQQDYKSQLQEFCLKHFKHMPTYTVVREVGPEHRKMFHIHVLVNREMCGEGWGNSKKTAEQAGAADALNKLRTDINGTKASS